MWIHLLTSFLSTVTLVSSAPEIQWVALRNINLLLQKRPDILPNEMRVFFCKYNDPPYVKVEKLDIMVRLAQPKNVDTLLSELKEYASEVDVDFVRKSIKAIGQTAIKIDDAAERCINVLLDLISTRVSYVVQEAIVVIKDIFRKYPHSYEGIIPTLCASLDELDEPEAKASLIWIIGEYADKIDNADDLLGIFLKTFKEESYQVQLQTLTAIVKLFLKKPDESQAIVQKVLQMATKDCDSPDVRDRAYVYWRLLSTDPAAAKVSPDAPSAHRLAHLSDLKTTPLQLGRRARRPSTDIAPSNERASADPGRAARRNLDPRKCLPQACRGPPLSDTHTLSLPLLTDLVLRDLCRRSLAEVGSVSTSCRSEQQSQFSIPQPSDCPPTS